jgi:hypothetical protein
MAKAARCHRDGTVSFWSVYLEQYMERQRVIPNLELMKMLEKERKRVLRYLKMGGYWIQRQD